VISRRRTSRRILLDRFAARTVIVGGIVIISAICAILFVIVGEIWPLFRAPRIEAVGHFAAPAVPAAGAGVGVDEYREAASVVTASGQLALVPLRQGVTAVAPVALEGLGAARVSMVTAYGGNRFAVGTDDGRVIQLELRHDVSFDGGVRRVAAKPVFAPTLDLDPGSRRPSPWRSSDHAS
jgi:ABC-type uncharacterized transport system permease subunit